MLLPTQDAWARMSATLVIERDLYFPGDVLRAKIVIQGISTLRCRLCILVNLTSLVLVGVSTAFEF